MKKLICALLALCLVCSFAGCSLFSDSSVAKLGDYTHKDPKGLSYDTRIVLKNERFGSSLEELVNSLAYPDTMICDESGSPTGMYDYDPETGLALGYTDLLTGEYTAFAAGEEVDLGKPDESQMISLGDATLYFVVYGDKDETVACDMYVMPASAGDKDTVCSAVSTAYGVELEAESDTVLKASMDKAAIAAELDELESQGYGIAGRDAKSYALLLQQMYGVREDGGVNPYKPYDGHEDPADLDFDERVVLTGSGQAAVETQYVDDVSSLTDFVYGKDGEVVAHYSYYECPSKEAADRLMDYLIGAERVDDTVVMVASTGAEMEQTLTMLTGYNVIKDKSVDEYVRMIEETYYSSVCEE